MMPLLSVISQWVFVIVMTIVLETHSMMNIPIIARRRPCKYRDRQDRLRLDGSPDSPGDVEDQAKAVHT
jgi:hypothetical protein